MSNLFEKYSKILPHIKYSEMKFSVNNVYLCHANIYEQQLYLDYDLAHNAFLELIPKGNIASKTDIDVEKYPVLCQEQAEKINCNAYLQAANVGSVTRYQGSEVRDDQKCYFIVGKNAVVSNREFYTAFTRCWDVKSFIIVDFDKVTIQPIKKFGGCKVKKLKTYITNDSKHIKINDDGTVDKEGLIKLLAGKDTDEIAYRTDSVVFKNEVYHTTIVEKAKRSRFSAMSLIKKSPEFCYNYMDEVYKIIDKKHITGLPEVHIKSDTNGNSKKDYLYQTDLYSAYPHIFHYGKMPISGILYNEYREDKLNFYAVWDESQEIIDSTLPLYSNNMGIITEPLKKLLETECKNLTFEFLFATDYQIGSRASKILYQKAYENTRTKKATKETHWGLYRNEYVLLEERWGERRAIINPESVYKPLIIAIISELYRISLMMRKAIYGTILAGGFINVDALYYDERNDEAIEKVLKEDLSEYHLDYRTYDMSDGKKELYRSFDVPSQAKYYRDKKKNK